MSLFDRYATLAVLLLQAIFFVLVTPSCVLNLTLILITFYNNPSRSWFKDQVFLCVVLSKGHFMAENISYFEKVLLYPGTELLYFCLNIRIRNMRPGLTYRFTIINLMKPSSLYNHGMKPVFYSEMKAKKNKVFVSCCVVGVKCSWVGRSILFF